MARLKLADVPVPPPDQAAQTASPRRMMTVEDVLAIVPVGRTTLFRMERDGLFPPSHYVSPNRRFWYADEVAQWQNALPTNSRISRKGVSARSKND
jgi:predicted DNA-binding transcriptional regulator AlpA